MMVNFVRALTHCITRGLVNAHCAEKPEVLTVVVGVLHGRQTPSGPEGPRHSI